MGNKILIVDDEEAVRNTFQKAFSIAGYTVHCAASAEEALSILKEEKIQIGFLDLNLPKMNGTELCKHIREEKALSIVYAVTGYLPILETANCGDTDFDGYLTKPVELKTLLNAAKEAFEKLAN